MNKTAVILILFAILALGLARRNCRKREVYKRCPGCPPTCQSPSPMVCLIRCSYRCVCSPPYILDVDSDRCVRNCPAPPTTKITILTPSHDDNPYGGTIYKPRGIH